MGISRLMASPRGQCVIFKRIFNTIFDMVRGGKICFLKQIKEHKVRENLS